jgi:hypothetical protein
MGLVPWLHHPSESHQITAALEISPLFSYFVTFFCSSRIKCFFLVFMCTKNGKKCQFHFVCPLLEHAVLLLSMQCCTRSTTPIPQLPLRGSFRTEIHPTQKKKNNKKIAIQNRIINRIINTFLPVQRLINPLITNYIHTQIKVENNYRDLNYFIVWIVKLLWVLSD